ncbi:VOC family protein [Ideonella sp. DXS22W]|uniref:VOC family protein n=1 Tax=Pseudaquabacterium inlustre TaxID=2984192 RepID=A0ABU9CGL2_9BURK
MTQQIFVNLPIADVAASRRFFSALGFGFNEQFSGDHALCMVVADNIFVMLLRRDFFEGFCTKPVVDARQGTEVLVCLSRDSRAAVDAMVAQAVAAGGSVPRPPQIHGDFMYGHAFEDLDGHVWELAWMNPDAAPPQA